MLTACSGASTPLEVLDARCRPPLGSGAVAVGYMTLRSSSGDRVVSVSSTAARAVEIHESVQTGGVSRMNRLESLELPAGESVVFEPGGRHLMIFDPLEFGPSATIPITIKLESGASVAVELLCRETVG
jgi:hypothetical protein